MSIEEIDILSLIPQRPPMIMIDMLTHYDPIVTCSSFTIKESSCFVEDDLLLPPGLVENIAQTCAARIGYINLQNNQEVKLGVIGSVQNLKVETLPKVGQTLTTKIEVTDTVFNVTIVKATISSEEQVNAQCVMKIAIIED